MPDLSFFGLFVVSAAAFVAPLLLGLLPRFRLPSVVLEIVLGIVIGPSVLGWVKADLPVQVLSLVGLAFLLFLAGLEVEVERLRGRPLRLSALGFLASFGLALAVGYALHGAGQVRSPLLVAIILSATSLGLVVPVLKDAGESGSAFGQLVIAGGTIADFAAVILLTLFFSREATGAGTKVVLLLSFVALLAAVAAAVARAGRSMRVSDVLLRLQDTTAQIRVRGAVLLLIGFVALAERFGLESILGAFMAGAVLGILDRDTMMTHPHFRVKLEAIGYGFAIPVFFVTSGVQFDASALFSSASTLARVPIFLVALLAVRGLPALLYRPLLDRRRVVVAGLLQSTSLPFIVAATRIGMALGKITAATGAALVAAGLLSVLVFPIVSLSILRGKRPARREPTTASGPETAAEEATRPSSP